MTVNKEDYVAQYILNLEEAACFGRKCQGTHEYPKIERHLQVSNPQMIISLFSSVALLWRSV